MADVTIAVESPLQDEVRVLVAELNAVLLELTPPEHCHHLTVEQMAGADTTVFIARDGTRAVGCGALKRHGDAFGGGIGEVKRMYTRPSHRGRKIGARIVERPTLPNLPVPAPWNAVVLNQRLNVGLSMVGFPTRFGRSVAVPASESVAPVVTVL